MRGKLSKKQLSDLEEIRTYGVISVLEKTNRILGAKDSQVKIRDHPDISAPAMTDGTTVIINRIMDPMKSALVKGFTPSSMMITTGLNYHELAHCLFMPRLGTPYIQKIQDMGMFQTFNILEDQTDETRFVKLYEPAKHYFSALVATFIMEAGAESGVTNESNYVLVSGRRFLPQRMRHRLMDAFCRQDLIPEIDELVGEYKSLVYPGDQTRMLQVVKEFHVLLNGISPPSLRGMHHSLIKKGEPDNTLSKELREIPEPSVEEEQDEESDQEDEGQGEEVQEEEPGEEPDDEEQGESAGQDGDEEEEEESSSDDPGEPSERAQDSGKSPEKVAEEVLEDLVDEKYDELVDRIDSVKEHSHSYRSTLEPGSKMMKTVTTQMNNIVLRCTDEFRVFEQEKAPGWSRNQRYGKLNPRHYARALRGDDQVFKRWKEGVHDALDFEVVFLLDLSSSMLGGDRVGNTKIERASQALWILRRTFDECDGVVTVLGFANGPSLLSQRFEKASRSHWESYQASGWTHVSEAIAEATRILDVSKKVITILVIVTDGGFSDSHAAVDQMARTHHPILLVGIDLTVNPAYEDLVMHIQTIDDPIELVDLVQKFSLKLSDEHSRRVM